MIIGFYLSVTANYATNRYDKNDYSIFYITRDSGEEKQIFFINNTYYKYTNYDRHMREFGTTNMYKNLLHENVYFVCTSEADRSSLMRDYLAKYYGNNHSVNCNIITTLNDLNELNRFYDDNKDIKFELSRTASDTTSGPFIIYQFTLS